jgi:CheY-like chemotaxis protein
VKGPILIVDDDDAIREVVALILRDEGYRVATAPDGAQALALIAQAPPSLVLLDLHLPVMSGWELQAHLRDTAPAIPVVFMTAGAQAREEARRHAAAGYLGKPFDLTDLLRIVARFAA